MTIYDIIQKYTKIRSILYDNKLKVTDSDRYMINIHADNKSDINKMIIDSIDTIKMFETGENLIVDKTMFVKQFNLATNWLFCDFNWDHTLVVNIYPLVCALNHNLSMDISLKQYLEALIGPTSIEICLYGLTTNDFMVKINDIIDHIKQVTSSEMIKRYTEDSIVIIISEPFQVITIYTIKYKSKIHCLYSLDNIGIIYDGQNTWASIKSYPELCTKTFIYDNNCKYTSEYNAYIRYLFELNFNVHIPYISQINPYALFKEGQLSLLLQLIAYFNGHNIINIRHDCMILDIRNKTITENINIISPKALKYANIPTNDIFDPNSEYDMFGRSKFVISLLFKNDDLFKYLESDTIPDLKYGQNNIGLYELLCAYAPDKFIVDWIEKWKYNMTDIEIIYIINLLVVLGNNICAITLIDDYIQNAKDVKDTDVIHKLFNLEYSLVENMILSNNLQIAYYLKAHNYIHYSNVNAIIRKTLPYISYEIFCILDDSIDYEHKINDMTLLNDIINELIVNKTSDLVMIFTKILPKCNIMYNNDISSEPLYQIIISYDYELFGIFMTHLKNVDEKFREELIANLTLIYDHYKGNYSYKMLSFIRTIYYYVINIRPLSDDLFEKYSKLYNQMIKPNIYTSHNIRTDNTDNKNVYKYIGKLSNMNMVDINYIDYLEKLIKNRDHVSLGLLLGPSATLCINKNGLTPYHWAIQLDDDIIFKKLMNIGMEKDNDNYDGLHDIVNDLLSLIFEHKSYKCARVLLSDDMINFMEDNITTKMVLSITDIDLLFNILVKNNNLKINISLLTDIKYMTNESLCFIHEYHEQIKYLENIYDDTDLYENNIMHLLADSTNLAKGISYIIENSSDKIDTMMVNKNSKGETPLMTAFKNNNQIIADLYLHKHTNMTDKDNNGDTIAHYLASNDLCLPLLDRIIHNKNLFAIRNNNNYDPIMISIIHNNIIFIRSLLNCGILDANNCDYYGNTYLHYICASDIDKNLCLCINVSENMENFMGIAPIDYIVTKIVDIVKKQDITNNYHNAKEIKILSRIYRYLINIKRNTDYENNYNILRGMIFSNNNIKQGQ